MKKLDTYTVQAYKKEVSTKRIYFVCDVHTQNVETDSSLMFQTEK